MNNKNKNNPFRAKHDLGSIIEQSRLAKIRKKTAKWGQVKFDPVAKLASQESATPWSTYKTEIIEKQNSDVRQSQRDSNVKQFNKIREENYRRNLIESKKKEPTKWEDFSEGTDVVVPPSKKNKHKPKEENVVGQFQQIRSKIKNIESLDKKDFDARLLTPNQNNYLKKVITSGTMYNRGSIEQAVKSLKLNAQKKKFKPRK